MINSQLHLVGSISSRDFLIKNKDTSLFLVLNQSKEFHQSPGHGNAPQEQLFFVPFFFQSFRNSLKPGKMSVTNSHPLVFRSGVKAGAGVCS